MAGLTQEQIEQFKKAKAGQGGERMGYALKYRLAVKKLAITEGHKGMSWGAEFVVIEVTPDPNCPEKASPVGSVRGCGGNISKSENPEYKMGLLMNIVHAIAGEEDPDNFPTLVTYKKTDGTINQGNAFGCDVYCVPFKQHGTKQKPNEDFTFYNWEHCPQTGEQILARRAQLAQIK